ncbi:hypothetical protein HDU93_002626 [Gonapodya sp. JEL0774]|nr:hypothetical protein HDU93_002626 [Gonapodya sp. JEL0774]
MTNQSSGLMVPFPADYRTSSVARLKEISRRMKRMKKSIEPYVYTWLGKLPAFSNLIPDGWKERLADAGSSSIHGAITNPPGPSRQLNWAGIPIERWIGFIPSAPYTTSFCIVTYGSQVSISSCTDVDKGLAPGGPYMFAPGDAQVVIIMIEGEWEKLRRAAVEGRENAGKKEKAMEPSGTAIVRYISVALTCATADRRASPEIVQVVSFPIAAVHACVSQPEIAKAFPPALNSVREFLSNLPDLGKGGCAVFLYKHPKTMPSPMDIEFGVEVKTEFKEAEGGVHCFNIPSGEAVRLSHFGAFDKLHPTHKEIRKWMDDNKRKSAGWSWEMYGDHDEDTTKQRTDIYYLLEPAATTSAV